MKIFEPLSKTIILMTISMTILVGMSVFAIYLIDKNIICPSFGRNVELPYKYEFIAGGCFVKYEGQWIPSDNLRAGKLD